VLPEIGTRKAIALAAETAELAIEIAKMRGISRILPGIAFEWNVPLGDGSRGTDGGARGGIDVEEFRVMRSE
jgi:hypothetical protein